MRTGRFIKRLSLLRGFEAALAAVLLAAVAPSAVAQAEVPAKKSDAIHEMSATFQELAKRVSPAIVEVMVTGYGAANEEDQNASSAVGRERSLGAGIIVESDGYIITNYHVVKGADRVRAADPAGIRRVATIRATALARTHSSGKSHRIQQAD